MIITSGHFENGGWMPDSVSGYGKNISPEINIENLPENTVSIAITMDDLDHPVKPGFNHWVAWNIAPTSQIPEALPKGAVNEEPIHVEQGVGYGKHCYKGPKPPFNWNHRYLFTVYALDCELQLDENSRKSDLLKAIDNHVLKKGEITGRYQRRHD